MGVVAGITLVLAGIAFPLAMLVWLARRLGNTPAVRPRQVGLWLAFNFMLPLGAILLGLSLISGRVATSTTLRSLMIASLIGAGVLMLGLMIDGLVSRRSGGNDAG